MAREMGDSERRAHGYADYGWHVFPVVPGGKAPAIRSAHEAGDTCQGECGKDGHGLYDGTTDHAKIERWWKSQPSRNVAIRTGAPVGPDVLDVDHHGEQQSGFPALSRLTRECLVRNPQATIRTPSGGAHLYFDGTNQGNGHLARSLIDFRSQGGYVLVPPSQVDGKPYELVGKTAKPGQKADWPKIREFLEPAQRVFVPRQPGREPGRDHGTADRVIGSVERGQPGNRNGLLHWAANRLIDAGQMTPGNMQRLLDASVRSGIRGGPREAEQTVRSVMTARQRTGSREDQRQPGG